MPADERRARGSDETPEPPRGAVVLTDPTAVRALAHPVRLAVIDALYAGEVLTATECAALVGVSPSAMSYHLRALEKHGIVVRAAARGDGRERPWMRAGDTLSTSFGRPDRPPTESETAAAGLLFEQALRLDAERIQRATRADAADTEGHWKRTTTYSRDLLVLTPEEATSLSRQITELTERYLAEHRRGTDRPDGAQQFGFSFLLARDP